MKNAAFQYIYHAYNSDKIWPPLSEPRFSSPLSTLRLVSSFSGVQSGVETSIRRSRFQHVSTAANCILHGCSAIMCTWPGRTKAYSETALCAGLLHPSTTAPCRWDTNTGTSLRVTRMHASVHPGLRRFRPGFQSVSKTDLLLLHVSNSILVACHLLEQLAPFIVQWFREIVRLTSLGIAPIFNSIAPSGYAEWQWQVSSSFSKSFYMHKLLRSYFLYFMESSILLFVMKVQRFWEDEIY